MEIHKKTGYKIDMIAEMLSPRIRRSMNYSGEFNPSAMRFTLQCIERRVIKWAMRKYKNFRGHRQRAEKWLLSIRQRESQNIFILLNDKNHVKGDLHVWFFGEV